MIHIDYGSLRADDRQTTEVDAQLVRKAQNFWARQARRDILRIMDAHVRLLAAEVSRRQVNPQLLYADGQDALLDAIKTYRVGQRESFKDFATVLVRQAMLRAKAKLAVSPR